MYLSNAPTRPETRSVKGSLGAECLVLKNTSWQCQYIIFSGQNLRVFENINKSFSKSSKIRNQIFFSCSTTRYNTSIEYIVPNGCICARKTFENYLLRVIEMIVCSYHPVTFFVVVLDQAKMFTARHEVITSTEKKKNPNKCLRTVFHTILSKKKQKCGDENKLFYVQLGEFYRKRFFFFFYLYEFIPTDKCFLSGQSMHGHTVKSIKRDNPVVKQDARETAACTVQPLM